MTTFKEFENLTNQLGWQIMDTLNVERFKYNLTIPQLEAIILALITQKSMKEIYEEYLSKMEGKTP